MIPFSRLYLILSSHTFQLFIAQHSLVQFLLHLVEEIGTAFVFPTFDVGIEAVAILRLNTEYLVEWKIHSYLPPSVHFKVIP